MRATFESTPTAIQRNVATTMRLQRETMDIDEDSTRHARARTERTRTGPTRRRNASSAGLKVVVRSGSFRGDRTSDRRAESGAFGGFGGVFARVQQSAVGVSTGVLDGSALEVWQQSLFYKRSEKTLFENFPPEKKRTVNLFLAILLSANSQ